MLFKTLVIVGLLCEQIYAAPPGLRFQTEDEQSPANSKSRVDVQGDVGLTSEIDLSSFTILEILNATLSSHDKNHDSVVAKLTDPFSQIHLRKVAWAVNFSAEAREALDKDDITFLPPDDEALDRIRRGRHHHIALDDLFETLPHSDGQSDFFTKPFKLLTDLFDSFITARDKEADRKRWSQVLGVLTRYSTLPGAFDIDPGLVEKFTAPTLLLSHGEGSEAIRVRLEPSYSLLPFPKIPSIKFNKYATTRGISIKAKNGYIHPLGAPLFPPFTTLDEAFLFPQWFSSFTSGIQRVGLQEHLPRVPHLEGLGSLVETILSKTLKSSSEYVTVFLPSNNAFARLGLEGNFFLNSPFKFNQEVLKGVLAYHIVPDITFYSDYYYAKDPKSVVMTHEEIGVPMPTFWFSDLDRSLTPLMENLGTLVEGNITHYQLPTLLQSMGNKEATLHVGIATHKSVISGQVTKQILVYPASGEGHPIIVHSKDFGTNSGVIQPVDTLIRPPRPARRV